MQLVEQQRFALKTCLLLIHIGRRCLPRWNPCIRSLWFPIFFAVEGHNWHTRWMYKLYRDRGRSSGGGALFASRGWWWGRGQLGGGRCHKVGGQDGVAAEGQWALPVSGGGENFGWVTASPTCLIGSTVNTIQKQRSIHNHRGSLAITSNGLRPLTRRQPSRPSVCEEFQTRVRGKLRRS
jgi:hypothetical protein